MVITLKLSNHFKCNKFLVLTVNYLVASILSLLFFEQILFANSHTEMYALGFVIGISFVLVFLVFLKTISIVGVAVSGLFSRLSLFIPVVFSVLFYNEVLNLNHFLGLTLTLMTIILFYFALNTSTHLKLGLKDFFFLFLLFLGVGLNDFGIKVFNETIGTKYQGVFFVLIFITAFVYSLFLVYTKNRVQNIRSYLIGILLGVVNILTTHFFVKAISVLPSYIFFPSANVGIIIVTTLAGLIIWKEKLNLYGYLSIIMGVIAVIMLAAE